ncbi:MAG: membrane protein insertase YidC [Candidatus Binatia bacterium]
MEKRTLMAVILSLLILIVYQAWVGRHYGTAPQPRREKQKTIKKAVAPPLKPKPAPYREPDKELATAPTLQEQLEEEVKVETDQYIAVLTNRGGRLKSFILKHYRRSVDRESPAFEMISTAPGVPYPLGLQIQRPKPFNDNGLMYKIQGGPLRLTGNAKGTLLFHARSPFGVTLTKKFTFVGSGYSIGLEVSAEGTKGQPPSLLLTSEANDKGSTKGAPFEGFLALIDSEIHREAPKALKEGKELNGPISWAGFGYTYFLFALLPENRPGKKVTVKQKGPALLLALESQSEEIAADKARYILFIGPKDLDVLKAMDKGLDQSINFGWFAFISIPFLYVLRFSHQFTSSYGIDIILLTLIIKLLTAPLTRKSYVSMKRMQKLQPQMERIKERFKDDKEKLNKEIMELYRRNKVNPLGGCLPMLFQFPVFLGLYKALLTPIELRHAPFMWIQDLSRPDWESLPLNLFGYHVGIPILVILMGVSMFVQQWMTPSAGDPNQRRMMLMMPVIFTAMFVTFPAGLTIYWLMNNILSIAQQYLINRKEQ